MCLQLARYVRVKHCIAFKIYLLQKICCIVFTVHIITRGLVASRVHMAVPHFLVVVMSHDKTRFGNFTELS